MLRIIRTALAVAIVAVGAAGCTGDRVEDEPAVVATVGGTPITIGTLDKHLPVDGDGPPVHTDIALPVPRQVALNKAIRDELFAKEAEARRLPSTPETGIVEGGNGQWWLARVDTVRLIAPQWDETFAHRIKTAMAWDAEQRRLSELETQLRAKWEVQIFPDRLSRTGEA